MYHIMQRVWPRRGVRQVKITTSLSMRRFTHRRLIWCVKRQKCCVSTHDITLARALYHWATACTKRARSLAEITLPCLGISIDAEYSNLQVALHAVKFTLTIFFDDVLWYNVNALIYVLCLQANTGSILVVEETLEASITTGSTLTNSMSNSKLRYSNSVCVRQTII